MKKMVIGLGLVFLAGCSTVAEMGARVNEEIDSYLAEREREEKYVQVVYPAELRQYRGDRQDADPFPWQPDGK